MQSLYSDYTWVLLTFSIVFETYLSQSHTLAVPTT
uniref:Uncharacterized protein n=1 Tax=Siphoviridae sp. ctGpg14 TaxID=2827824 RepID=A0A8S5T632_9CAUD|nr:MAG TPA: hypothetical protein [Siphoviridae sp. ctGpg14]